MQSLGQPTARRTAQFRKFTQSECLIMIPTSLSILSRRELMMSDSGAAEAGVTSVSSGRSNGETFSTGKSEANYRDVMGGIWNNVTSRVGSGFEGDVKGYEENAFKAGHDGAVPWWKEVISTEIESRSFMRLRQVPSHAGRLN